MSDAPVLLEMRAITKEFPGVKALSDVNLVVRRGEIHAIAGENGAGKSTLMKVLSGVYPYGSYSGEIIYRGEESRFPDIRASEQAGIVIIHQELALVPGMSITENIFLGNEPQRGGAIDWKSANRQALELMARVGLREDPDTLIKDIGVGKQQLVEIAKAFAKDVKLLILDEPTAALNESDSQHLLDLLRGFKQRGITSIIISHKLNEIAEIADSITILRDGKTIETLDVKADGVDEDRIVRGMVGRELSSRFPDHTPKIGEVFFEVRDWTVRHPISADRMVAKGSSFTVRRGEIVGFAGLMGAGRTELAMSVFGRSYGVYQGGQIFKDGQEIVLKSVADAIKHGLAYVSEDRKSLGLNLLDDIKTSVVSAKLSKITGHGVVDPVREYQAAEGYRKSLRVKAPNVDEGVTKLSGGNQQKVVLAKWMFTDPDLLILDEPTRGIDVGAKYEIYGIIQQLADQGKGVIVISSELPELIGLCDRIYTVFEGTITGNIERRDADPELLMKQMTSAKKAQIR
ncbi:multiple monosaccharide ABC transporter ATP-binding protein [Plantactinospora sp. KLBMP9567]|uniref:multiple monosaccharide ABC transporter ATP-binding protein n=1 Tax=Plantactinospora sp. KLBMP9567 TaxID=3085900 RepID=UPI002982589B|nr:multiple monosaccharide ABC transporter ATP-binding protein [Plantactinospora sp. KLBMP9567]MDW5325721.1 multiple monosaccharide ABC transporter ATP-binding protein [Plantactinospora sp. KLBMP9567]